MPTYSTLYELRAKEDVSDALSRIDNLQDAANRGLDDYQAGVTKLGRKGVKSFDEAKKRIKALRSEAAKLEKGDEFDRLTREADELSDIIDQHAVPSTKDLRQELAKLKKQQDASIDPQQIAAYDRQIQKLDDTIRQRRQQSFDRRDTSRGGPRMGDFRDEALSRVPGGEMLGGMSGAGLLAGAGIGAAVSVIGTLGAQSIQASAKIDELRRNIETLGLAHGDFAQQAAADVASIAQTFDKEQNEVLVAAKNLSQQTGATMGQALDQIKRGFLNGADASGEFLNQLKQYPSALSGTGAGMKEMTDLAIIAEREGVYSDKAIDAVKEGTLRLREFTDSTRDALAGAFGEKFTSNLHKNLTSGKTSLIQAVKIVSDKMKTTRLTTEQEGSLLADVFGGAGEDAGAAFVKGLGQLGDGIKEQVDPAKRALLDANDALARAQAELGRLTGTGKNTFEVLKTEAMTFVTEGLNNLISKSQDYISLFDDIAGGFDSVFGDGALAQIGKYASRVWDVVSALQPMQAMMDPLGAYDDLKSGLGFGPGQGGLSGASMSGLSARGQQFRQQLLGAENEQQFDALAKSQRQQLRKLGVAEGGDVFDRFVELQNRLRSEALAGPGGKGNLADMAGGANGKPGKGSSGLATKVQTDRTRSTNVTINIDVLKGADNLVVQSTQDGARRAGEEVRAAIIEELNQVNTVFAR